MPILTLTTDFGSKDGFVGTMKGVILGISPHVEIVDISHEIAPQGVREGAFTLWRAYAFFPLGTIHIAVVDPGVGTKRRAIAAQVNGHLFVGPDNGIFTFIINHPIYRESKPEFHHLNNHKYFLKDVSNTFHGRDIFSSVGAHLANGVPLSEMGPVINDPVLLPFTKPEKTDLGWKAHIAYIDHFGNCTTDLPASRKDNPDGISIQILGKKIKGLSTSYGDHAPGALIALIDSEGFIEIALVNGNAAEYLGASIDDIVEIINTKPKR
jgi:S-adenosyl-L-methionine hydrolase (adenosine-forming)